MVTTRRLIVLVLLLAGLTQPGTAQQAAPPQNEQAAPPPTPQGQPQPTFRAGINYVAVDVIVKDRRDNPVIDLRKEEFEVFEDGKPQPIEEFRLVKIDSTAKPGDPVPRRIRSRDDEQAEASREDVRVFAILLDDYHTRKLTSMSIREPLTKFLQTQLAPTDLVAIMYPLTPVSDLLFTNDHASIVSAVQRFEGRKFDYVPRNRFEEQYARIPPQEVERIRNDVVMDALSSVAVRMGSMRQGRKSIIFVSEGFTIMLPPQMQRLNAQDPIDPRIAVAGAAVQDSPQQQSAEFFNQAMLDSRLREVYRDVNRNNVSIYSLDPRGLTPFEYDIDAVPGGASISFQTDRRALQMTQDTLKALSEETDGRAIVNRNSLDQGLASIVRDSSFYYLLGYNSTQAQNDGKFHEIRVRVKRSGVDVRARKGYWALTEADVKRVGSAAPTVAKPIMSALASIAPSVQAGKFVRMWVGTERGSNGKTRVTLIWEPLLAPPGTTRREQAGRVSLLAATASGELVFRGAAPEQSATPAPGTANGPQRLTFESPPGKLELRLTVQDAGNGTLDQETKTIDVPDLTAPVAAITTPRVLRARTVREFQTLAADAAATPTVGREFSRTERLLIRFDAYAAGSEQVQPTAILLNRAGTKMADVPVAAAQAGGTHQINLSLASIPAGEYLVEIAVSSASGEAKELVPFRVGS
ncbi:MAG TPA: VWA domain-containing protein [Vicinamibacterales bacterium]|nr:VWA domain-containing protein [Vicinamibacterales bacterium]